MSINRFAVPTTELLLYKIVRHSLLMIDLVYKKLIDVEGMIEKFNRKVKIRVVVVRG